MDFSGIKKIEITEGEVKQISKNGVILWKKRGIPSEYQQLDSISCDGTNYIDLGYKHNNSTMIKMRARIGEGAFPFGSRDWAGYNSLVLWRSDVDKLALMITTTDIYQISFDSSEILDFEFDNHHFKINETELTYETTIGTPTVNEVLFGMQDISGVYFVMEDMTVYSFQIYENGNVVKDLKPVKRISDGVEGLYDIENEEFLPFTSGGGYKPLKYLKSTGTQYINTDYNHNNDTEVNLVCDISEQIAYGYLFGARNYAGNGVFVLHTSVDKGLNVAIGSNTYPSNVVVLSINTTLNKDKFIVNGVEITLDGYIPSASESAKCLIFGISDAYGNKYLYTGQMKVYRLTIKENGVLIKDMLPALRLSDNKPGMYDAISGTFYTNQGTGEFEYE